VVDTAALQFHKHIGVSIDVIKGSILVRVSYQICSQKGVDSGENIYLMLSSKGDVGGLCHIITR